MTKNKKSVKGKATAGKDVTPIPADKAAGETTAGTGPEEIVANDEESGAATMPATNATTLGGAGKVAQ